VMICDERCAYAPPWIVHMHLYAEPAGPETTHSMCVVGHVIGGTVLGPSIAKYLVPVGLYCMHDVCASYGVCSRQLREYGIMGNRREESKPILATHKYG